MPAVGRARLVHDRLLPCWMLAQIAHVNPDVAFPDEKEKEWGKMQARTSANFSTDSPLMIHLSGALTFQIEHHLFPNICHCHYRRISPIVQQACRDHKVPYVSYKSFWDAVAAHWRHVQQAGQH